MMPAEFAAQVYQDFEPETHRAPHLRVVDPIETDKPVSDLEQLVDHFDRSWRQEGLPRDWYNFGEAGFSMDSQMNLLQDTNPESKDLWINQTEQDVKGFVVEYLKGDLVHPSFYRTANRDEQEFLMDKRYKKGMVETVSARERNGAVRDGVSDIQKFMLDGGGMAVMTSPQGWTGLQMDSGEPIEYKDAFFFGFKGNAEGVVGFGIKTDFTISECRRVIQKLTGRDLAPGSSLEEYVKAIAMIKPGEGISSAESLVDVLEEVRGNEFAYKDQTWMQVREDLARLEQIYALEQKADQYLRELGEYVLEDGRTKFDLQKGLAATLLRLSEHYLVKKKQTALAKKKYTVLGNVIYPERFQQDELIGRPTYGEILNEVEKIPGCAGGGADSESINSIIDRQGIAGGLGFKLPEDKYGAREVKCPSCGQISIRPKDKLFERCLHCSSDKIAC